MKDGRSMRGKLKMVEARVKGRERVAEWRERQTGRQSEGRGEGAVIEDC